MSDDEKLDGEGDLLHGLPADVARQVRQIWRTQVAGGSARYKQSGDRRGPAGQQAVSQLVISAGVERDGARWIAIRDFGRSLYYGSSDRSDATARTPARPAAPRRPPTAASSASFRARAEAHQVWYRKEVLAAGCAEHAHHLDAEAVARGANFVGETAHASARARSVAGKGVQEVRTFGNMLSSQALCFNLFGTLGASEEGREIAAEVLHNFLPDVMAVASIVVEHTPDFEVFRDQRGDVGVDADVLIELDTIGEERWVLVIETKLVETSFSTCGHRRGKPTDCPANVVVGEDHRGCAYAARNGYLYWSRTAENGTVRRSLVTEEGCPFGGRLWQPWVNHTLAHAEARRRGASRALFAVVAPEENEELDAGGAIEELRRELTDPDTALFFPLEEMLMFICAATARRGDAWPRWAAALRQRYALPRSAGVPHGPAVTRDHRATVSWMKTAAFEALVRAFDAAAGAGRVYFRPTDKGLVMIGLHDSAPCYVGVRVEIDDDGHCVTHETIEHITQTAAERWQRFERWLPSVRRCSDEERGTIPWLRKALANSLWLPEIGPGWAFLVQEWRFRDTTGVGRKSDILAVHLPTGQLGIVELKDADGKLGEAAAQVSEYGDLWARDGAQLAPLFTEILQSQGRVYGNEVAAAAIVRTGPAHLFVGVASPGRPVRVMPTPDAAVP